MIVRAILRAMATAVAPIDVARHLFARLEGFQPTPDAVKRAKRRVRAQRRRRREPPGKKGHEYIVEALLRPVITRLAARMLGLKSRDELPCRIYSSHFHTTDDREEIWRQRFACFRWIHPSADTFDRGNHRRRADLFIATQINRLVSVEFKYVTPGQKPSANACARQVRQYLSQHKACVLVIYAGEDVSFELNTTCDEIQGLIRSKRAFVVAIRGPAMKLP